MLLPTGITNPLQWCYGIPSPQILSQLDLMSDGDILSSPICNTFYKLFILNLKESDLGCHIAGVFYSRLLYAHDNISISLSFLGLQICLTFVIPLALYYCSTFNGNKRYFLCMGDFYEFNFYAMTLGANQIACCEQITYLGVVLNAGTVISFDINQTRCPFSIACNNIFAFAFNTNESLHLSL